MIPVGDVVNLYTVGKKKKREQTSGTAQSKVAILGADLARWLWKGLPKTKLTDPDQPENARLGDAVLWLLFTKSEVVVSGSVFFFLVPPPPLL